MIENKNQNTGKLVEIEKDNMPDPIIVNVSKTNDLTVDIPNISYTSKNKLKLKGKSSKRNRYDNNDSN